MQNRSDADDNVLIEAQEITSSDRQRYYGHPADNHGCTAELWDIYLERRRTACEDAGEVFVLDARDVCWLNVLQKASRDANQRKRDNLVDGCGYLRNAEMVEQREDDERKAWERQANQTADAFMAPVVVVTEDGGFEDCVEEGHGVRGSDGKFHTLDEVDEHDHGRPDGFTDGY